MLLSSLNLLRSKMCEMGNEGKVENGMSTIAKIFECRYCINKDIQDGKYDINKYKEKCVYYHSCYPEV